MGGLGQLETIGSFVKLSLLGRLAPANQYLVCHALWSLPPHSGRTEKINNLEKNLNSIVSSELEGRLCTRGSRGVHESEADELRGQVPLPLASLLRTRSGIITSLALGCLERAGPFISFIATGFQESVCCISHPGPPFLNVGFI